MKNSRRKIAALIICLVAVVAIVSGSLAWYTSTNSVTQYASLAGFTTKAKVYRVNDEGKEISLKADEKGLYTLSSDPEADNFIGNLKIKVVHRGYANSYVRVKMSIQWTMPDGTVTQNVVMPFEFAEKWYDNRENDYCVYYTEETGLFESHDKSIITGFDVEKFSETTMTKDAVAKVAVIVESVQANRYQQIWGIETLPWK